MKTVAKITCAAGAMLFGGTLGQAHAGVVGLTGAGNSRAYLTADNDSTYSSTFASGSPIAGAVSFFSQAGLGSATCSQFTASGFSLSATYRQGTRYRFDVVQNFVTTSSVDYSLVGSADGDDYVFIELFNADGSSTGTVIFPTTSGSFSLSGSLAATTNGQYYRFEHYGVRRNLPNASETLFTLSFTDGSVPAPGAIALLGLAGAARRRRRGQG
jgi:MYXO-CTERM domain-containing protein